MLHRRNSMDTASTFDCDVPSLSPRRLVLLGKSGVGKSAAGNTILGQKEFRYVRRMNSVTRESSVVHATVSGRSVSVVDTPGLSHTEMDPEELMTEIARSVHLSSPGPHAFLIVIRVTDTFTEQEEEILQQIEMMFGQEVLKYSFILFTHGDWLNDIQTIMEIFPALRRLVDQCGGRFHVFNNEDENNREQVNDLLQKIDSMIEQNGGHYSNQMYEDALRIRREEEERRQREEEQRKPQEKGIMLNIGQLNLPGVGAICGGLLDAAVGGLAGPVGAAVGGLAGPVGAAVGALAGPVGAAVGALAGPVGAAVGALAGPVGAAVGALAGPVGAAVGGLAGPVGAAVGGLAGPVGAAVGKVVGKAAGEAAGKAFARNK